MMNDYKLSIIIAMYNIEYYIEHCLDTCVNQIGVSESDYEIIVVNDGSTDSSVDKVSKFVLKYSNVRLLNKKNGGLSDARNYGLSNCTGEYVWFVDGDDAITSDAVGIILENISNRNDAYIINFSTFSQNGVILRSSAFKNIDPPVSGNAYHHQTGRILPVMAWLTIYRIDFLRNNNLIFCKNILHEDFEFSVRAHHLSHSISSIPNNLYLYRIERTGSIMSDVNVKCVKSLKSHIDILDSFKLHFYDELNSEFFRNLCEICAVGYFETYYRASGYKDSVARAYFLETRKVMYKELRSSRRIKRIIFFVAIIFLPDFVLSQFFRNSAVKLM